MTASLASKAFGRYLDTVQREPVVITKQNRAVAITLSIQEAEKLFQDQIDQGIEKGLSDVDAGRVDPLTSEHIAQIKQVFKSSLE
ncbi:MAG: hypothetical protein ACQES2_03880 [Pseudomonadota bacterium]